MPTKKQQPKADVLSDVLWTEKHRPAKLDDLALTADNRAILTAYIAAGEIPHLLFSGPAGIGKTTIARILLNNLDCRRLTLNASKDRGIDIVREQIGMFVRMQTEARWQIVFLDEADALTPDAQLALKNLIEAYTDRARFILTANKPQKITAPIQSRCVCLTLTSPPLKERYRILRNVLKLEGIPAEQQIILGYAERYPDMREMLFGAQKAYLANGKLPPARGDNTANGVKVLELLLAKNWTGLRRLTATDAFDAQTAMREAFWTVGDDHARAGFMRHILGKGVHESGWTPDPIVHFLGVCAEVIEGL